MSSIDFRAGQFRGAKLISSGSTGTGAKFVFYDISADSTSNPNNGVIDPAKFDTGSIGTDIFLFISGGSGKRGVGGSNAISVFGGDLVISGNLFLAGTSNIGSNTLWQSTTNNIIFTTGSVLITGSTAIGGDTFVSGNFYSKATSSFGSTPISSMGSDVQVYFSGTVNKVPQGSNQRNTVFATDTVFSGTILLRSSSANPVNFIVGPANNGGIAFSGSQIAISSQNGVQIGGFGSNGNVFPINEADALFFISGTIGGKNSSTRGIAVVGGDLVVSGNLYVEGTNNPNVRVVSGTLAIVSASDFGNAIAMTMSSSITASFTNALTASFPTNKFAIVVIQIEATGAMPLISMSGGSTMNGLTTAYTPPTGSGVYSFTSRNGLDWFR
jgi:hypothetical protein